MVYNYNDASKYPYICLSLLLFINNDSFSCEASITGVCAVNECLITHYSKIYHLSLYGIIQMNKALQCVIKHYINYVMEKYRYTGVQLCYITKHSLFVYTPV